MKQKAKHVNFVEHGGKVIRLKIGSDSADLEKAENKTKTKTPKTPKTSKTDQ